MTFFFLFPSQINPMELFKLSPNKKSLISAISYLEKVFFFFFFFKAEDC